MGVEHGQSVKGSGLIRLGAPGPPGAQASCKKHHHPTKGRRCGDPSTGGPCRFSIVSVTPLPSPLAQVGVNSFPFLLTAPLALKASPHPPNSHNLPLLGTHWLCFSDPQMTGLDIEKDQILEMACLITDSGLNILAEVSCGSSWLS